MKKLVTALLTLLTVATPATLHAETTRKPNIIFILSDDLGWSDLNCYGNTFHETPNLDRLAARGMRFTNYHSPSPVCSPARASILTGLYAENLGMTQPAAHIPLEVLTAFLPRADNPKHKVVEPKSTTRLDTKYTTIAEVLKDDGYLTAHYGKWHVGLKPYSPVSHGFQIDVPDWQMHGPNGTYLGPKPYGPGFELPQGEHLEDWLSDKAADYIHQNKAKPFFLNYWAFSVHSPYVAKPELIAKYEKKAASLPENAVHRNPLYAAMVQSLDEAVGKLLDAIDEAGIQDNTIIIFTSDNGPEVNSIRENGQAPWTNAPKRMLDIPITSNYPYKGGKGTLHEGGTRVPCIVVWPGKTKPSSVSDAMFSGADFFPTILDMVNVAHDRSGLDGISQVGPLRGGLSERASLHGWWPNYPPDRLKGREGAPGAWIQQDGFKLIRYFHDAADNQDRLELYNLSSDPGETQNLVDTHPERVSTMLAAMNDHFEKVGALLPFPNPNYAKQ